MTQGSLQLYDYFRSSAAYRLRIALNLKGLAYDKIAVDLLHKENMGDAYKSVNPQGRVPALAVGGTVLLQSMAILDFLDEAYPDTPALIPGDPLDKAKVRGIADIIACDVHPLNNISVLRYLKGPLGHDQGVVDAWYAHWITEGFAAIEEIIKDEKGPFAMGAEATLVDVCLMPQLYNARRFNVPLEKFERILAVEHHCSTIDAFKRAHPDV